MKTRFINYLYFSHKERLGAVALIIFCVAVFSTPALFRWLQPQRATDFSDMEAQIRTFRQSCAAVSEAGKGQPFDFDPNLASLETFKQLGLSEKVAQNICRYREKGGAFRKPDDFKKIWSLHPDDYARLLPYIHISMGQKDRHTDTDFAPSQQAFSFNPNTAPESELLQLGLPERTVRSILNYRAKGGVFHKKEDLGKIYTLNESDYARLEPFIRLTSAEHDSLPPKGYSAKGGYFPQKNIPKEPIDLNSASLDELMRLPLVGEKRASQILRFRENLGGFLTVQQLSEMYNLPDSVYQRIQPLLTISSAPARKLNLNTATLEALDAHPYISKKQAELITAYRAQHGYFASPQEVLKIKAFTDMSWWEKISPYLAVQ